VCSSDLDKEIIEEVRKVENYAEIKNIEKEKAIQKGLYNIVGKEIDELYMQALKKQVINPEVIKEQQRNIKIVYTPLHGTGNIPVQTILKQIGFENVYIVPEQEMPDGNFPTVSYPNPEAAEAFELALKLARKEDADLVLATDPDADRLGVYAKDSKTGKYMSFTGNMSAMIIAEYVISQKQAKGILPKNGTLIKSIVSTNMADAIAQEYGLELIDVLTGFKYIGEQIKKFEENNEKEYVFGFEESYGCLVGTHARDKDAIVAVMLLCEAATFYKRQGLTLWDQMINLYEKYGYYKEGIVALTMEGADGAEKIQAILEKLRKNVPTKFGSYNIVNAKDYSISQSKNMQTGETITINLPKSNVLYYDLEDNGWCCVRPSGTEPKIKFYMGIKAKTNEEADQKLEELKKAVLEEVE